MNSRQRRYRKRHPYARLQAVMKRVNKSSKRLAWAFGKAAQAAEWFAETGRGGRG